VRPWRRLAAGGDCTSCRPVLAVLLEALAQASASTHDRVALEVERLDRALDLERDRLAERAMCRRRTCTIAQELLVAATANDLLPVTRELAFDQRTRNASCVEVGA
jgi:hypothetical protein